MILIIGDNNDASLKHYQNLIVTDNYGDAWTLIENTRFDLIFFDLALDYSEFSAQIKTVGNINSKSPVFAMIPPSEATNKENMPPGFVDWLAKPITAQRLNDVIERWHAKALDYIQIMLGKTNNNQRLALTIFDKLFDELPEQITRIKAALDDGQYDLVREIAHRLNGSASFCGLTDIQQAANTLEHCLTNNELIALDRHFLTLEQCSLDLIQHENIILANLGKC
ncbi:MAG: Hpt domain-containing protein [Methylobacter sp.]